MIETDMGDLGAAALVLAVSLLAGPVAHAQDDVDPSGQATEIFFERCDVSRARPQIEQAWRDVQLLVAEGYSRKRILEIARTIPEDCSSTSFAAAIRELDPGPPPDLDELRTLKDGHLIWFGADLGAITWIDNTDPPKVLPPLPVIRFDHGRGKLRGNLLLAANLKVGVHGMSDFGLLLISTEVYFAVGGLTQGGRAASFATFVVGGGVTVYPNPYPSETPPVFPTSGVGGSFGGLIRQRGERPWFRLAVEPRFRLPWYGDFIPCFEITLCIGGAR